MEIFLATDLLAILEKGGSTYPWMMKLENPEILSEKAQFLQENGHPCGDVEGIIDYLCTVKNKSDIFLHILNRQLS